MQYRHSRSVQSLIAAAGLAAAVFAVPATYAQATGNKTTDAPKSSSSAKDQLDLAADLLTAGKVVQAKGVLTNITSLSGVDLSDDDRARALKLISSANNKLKSLSPIEQSLQTAEDCVQKGDLRTAQHQLAAVTTSPKTTRGQNDQALSLLEQIKAKRTALTSHVSEGIAQGKADFAAGRYAQSKAAFDTIYRSGVELSSGQEETVTEYQTKIVDLENKQGTIFRTSAGMFQPGVVKERDPQPADAPAAPAAPAAAQPEAPAPVAPAPAAPVAIPEKQPEPAPKPQNDPIIASRSVEAQALMAEADQAFEKSNYTEAQLKYGRLINEFSQYLTQEQLKHATEQRAEAFTRLNEGKRGDIDTLQERIKLHHDEAVATYSNDMERSRRALETSDYNGATDLVLAAKLAITSSREYFAQSDSDRLLSEADTLKAQIEKARFKAEQDNLAIQIKDQRDQAEAQRTKNLNERQSRINESLVRVRALQKEMKYEEAIQVCDQILFLDPINPSALVLRDVLRDTHVYITWANIQNKKQSSYRYQELDNQSATIAPMGIIDYPSDWPKITYNRGEPAAFADAEENRRVLAVLQTKRVPTNFNENGLADVVKYIATVANVNVDVDWQSLESKGIEKETPVTLNLTNVSIETVLDRVVEKVSQDPTSGAAWSINNGVLTIASREVINKNKVLAIYDIRDLLIEIPDYDNAPEFDLNSVLQSTSGGRGGGGGGQSPFKDQGNQKRVKKPLDERTKDIIDIIQTNVDSIGWQSNGGDVGFVQELGGSLIITNTPANHRAIQGLLRKLREVRSMQINVETRFLLVSQDFFEQIGFDIDLYFNANNNQVRAARAITPDATASNFFNFTRGGYQGGAFTPPAVDVNRSNTTGDVVGEGSTALFGARPSPLSPIGAAGNSLGITEGLTSGSFANGLLSGAPALGVAGQFLDDIQVDFLVKATQADRRTVALTAPRLTFTNGQTSNIYVATQVAFVSDLTPVVSESAVGFDPTLGAVNEGVRLLVEGTISADRRYVTLNVDASVAKIEGFENTPVSAVAGGQLVNSAATQSFIQRPTVTVTRVQTTVTVPDQGTILLGGQRIVTEQEVESGVPVLSKIPIINRFFSNRITTKEEQTLLILLKPTILIQNEEEERNFPGLSDSVRLPN